MEINLWKEPHAKASIEPGPHKGQEEILRSNSRFKVIVCGRRWGKTLMAIIILLSEALNNPEGLYWYIAPTYRQAKNIAWRILRTKIRLFPKWFQEKCTIRDKELYIELPNGSIIELKGAQEPDSLVGSGLDGVVLDEYAMDVYGESPVWKEAIRPALSDREGWAIFISTPRGYNHFYELYHMASTDNKEWKAWRMPTSTNPYISRSELLSAKREVGADIFSQEYDAEFRKRSGLVYKEFDRSIHVIDEMNPEEISPAWKMEVGIDFGTAHPTAAIFVMFDNMTDTAYVVDEHYESEWSIGKHHQALVAKENYWMIKRHQKVPKRVGDSQGKQFLLEFAKNGYFITPTPKGAGSVGVGTSEVRKRLEIDPLTRKPKLLVCRNCVNTIREFENYAYSDDTRIEDDELMSMARKGKDEPRKLFDDAMDALRYVIQYHNPGGTQSVYKHSIAPRNPITGR